MALATVKCDHCQQNTEVTSDAFTDTSKFVTWCVECSEVDDKALLEPQNLLPCKGDSSTWSDSFDKVKAIPKRPNAQQVNRKCDHCTKDVVVDKGLCDVNLAHWCLDCEKTDGKFLDALNIPHTINNGSCFTWPDHSEKVKTIPRSSLYNTICDHCGKFCLKWNQNQHTIDWCQDCVKLDAKLLTDAGITDVTTTATCIHQWQWESEKVKLRTIPKKVTETPVTDNQTKKIESVTVEVSHSCDHCGLPLKTQDLPTQEQEPLKVFWCKDCVEQDGQLLKNKYLTFGTDNSQHINYVPSKVGIEGWGLAGNIEALKQIPKKEISSHYNVWNKGSKRWTNGAYSYPGGTLSSTTNVSSPAKLTLEQAQYIWTEKLSSDPIFEVRHIATNGVSSVPFRELTKAQEETKPESVEKFYNVWNITCQRWTTGAYKEIIPSIYFNNVTKPLKLSLASAKEACTFIAAQNIDTFEVREIAADGVSCVEPAPITKSEEVAPVKDEAKSTEPKYCLWRNVTKEWSGVYCNEIKLSEFDSLSGKRKPHPFSYDEMVRVRQEQGIFAAEYEVRQIAADGISSIDAFKESPRYGIWSKSANGWSDKKTNQGYLSVKYSGITYPLLLNVGEANTILASLNDGDLEIRQVAEDRITSISPGTHVNSAMEATKPLYGIYFKPIHDWSQNFYDGKALSSHGIPAPLSLARACKIISTQEFSKGYEIRQIGENGTTAGPVVDHTQCIYNVWNTTIRNWTGEKLDGQSNADVPGEILRLTLEQAEKHVARLNTLVSSKPYEVRIIGSDGITSVPRTLTADTKPEVYYNLWHPIEQRWTNSQWGGKKPDHKIDLPAKCTKEEAEQWLVYLDTTALEVRAIAADGVSPIPLVTSDNQAKDNTVYYNIWYKNEKRWTRDSHPNKVRIKPDLPIQLTKAEAEEWLKQSFTSADHFEIRAIASDGISSVEPVALAAESAKCQHCQAIIPNSHLPAGCEAFWCGDCVKRDEILLNNLGPNLKRAIAGQEGVHGWTNANVPSLKHVPAKKDVEVVCDHCGDKIQIPAGLDLSVYWCRSCVDNDKHTFIYLKDAPPLNIYNSTDRYAGWKTYAPVISKLPKKGQITHLPCNHCGKEVANVEWFQKNKCTVLWCADCCKVDGYLSTYEKTGHTPWTSNQCRGWKDSEKERVVTIPKKKEMVTCACCSAICTNQGEFSTCRTCAVKVGLADTYSRSYIQELLTHTITSGANSNSKHIQKVKDANTQAYSSNNRVPCFCCGNTTASSDSVGHIAVCPECSLSLSGSKQENAFPHSRLNDMVALKWELEDKLEKCLAQHKLPPQDLIVHLTNDIELGNLTNQYPELTKNHQHLVLVYTSKLLDTIRDGTFLFGPSVRQFYFTKKPDDLDVFVSNGQSFQEVIDKLTAAKFNINTIGDRTTASLINGVSVYSSTYKVNKDGYTWNLHLHQSSDKAHDTPFILPDVDINRLALDWGKKTVTVAPGLDLKTVQQHINDYTYELPPNMAIPASVLTSLKEKGYTPLTTKTMGQDKSSLKFGDRVSLTIYGTKHKATVFATAQDPAGLHFVLDVCHDGTSGASWAITSSWPTQNTKDAFNKLPNAKELQDKKVCWHDDGFTALDSIDGNIMDEQAKVNLKNLVVGDIIEFEYKKDGEKYLGSGVVLQEAKTTEESEPELAIFIQNEGNVKTANGKETKISGWAAKRLPESLNGANQLGIDAEAKVCYYLDDLTTATKVTGKYAPPPINSKTVNIGDKVELELNLAAYNNGAGEEKTTVTAHVVGIYNGEPVFSLHGGNLTTKNGRTAGKRLSDYNEFWLEAKRIGAPNDQYHYNCWFWSTGNTAITKVVEKAPPLVPFDSVKVGDAVEVKYSSGRVGKAVAIAKENDHITFAYEKRLDGLNLYAATTEQLPLLQKYGLPNAYNIFIGSSSNKIYKNYGPAPTYVEHKNLKVGDVVLVDLHHNSKEWTSQFGIVANIINGAPIMVLRDAIKDYTGTTAGICANAADHYGWDVEKSGTWNLTTNDRVHKIIEHIDIAQTSFADCKVGDLVRVEVWHNGTRFTEEALVAQTQAGSTGPLLTLVFKNRRDVATNVSSNIKPIADKHGFSHESTQYIVDANNAVIHKIIGKAPIKSLDSSTLKAGDLVEVCVDNDPPQTAVVLQSASESPYKNEPVVAFLKPNSKGWVLDKEQTEIAKKYSHTLYNDKVGRRIDNESTFVTKVTGQRSLSVSRFNNGDKIQLQLTPAYATSTPLPPDATVLSVESGVATVLLSAPYNDNYGTISASKFPTPQQKIMAKAAGIDLADNDARIFRFGDNDGVVLVKEVPTETKETQTKNANKTESKSNNLNPNALQAGDKVVLSITAPNFNNGKTKKVSGIALGIEYNGYPLVFLDDAAQGAITFSNPANVNACKALGFNPSQSRGWTVNPSTTTVLEVAGKRQYIDLTELSPGDKVQVEYEEENEDSGEPELKHIESIYLGRDNDGDHMFYFEDTDAIESYDPLEVYDGEVPEAVITDLKLDNGNNSLASYALGLNGLKVKKVIAPTTLKRSQAQIEEDLEEEGYDITRAETYAEQDKQEKEDAKALEYEDKLSHIIENHLNLLPDLEVGDRISIEIHSTDNSDVIEVRQATVLDLEYKENPDQWHTDILLALDEPIDIDDLESAPIKDCGKAAIKSAKKYNLDLNQNLAWAIDDHTYVTKVLADNPTTQNGEENMPYNAEGDEITLMDMLKADGVNAGYRVAASQMTKGVKGAILMMLKDKGMDGGKIATISELLDNEFGEAFIGAALGYGLTYMPMLSDDPRAQRLSEEFRVGSMALAGNTIMSSVMEHLLPAVNDAMNKLPPLEAPAVKKPAKKRIAKTNTTSPGGAELENGGSNGGSAKTLTA